MSAATENRPTLADSLVFIAAINAIFWALALGVTATHLPGTECFGRLLPVLVGGFFIAGVALAVTWRQRTR